MGGCGSSCGCGSGVTWTREKLGQLWDSVRELVSSGASPAPLLAQSFQGGVDATRLDDDSAEVVARLWLVWGVAEAAEGLALPAQRGAKLQRAAGLLEDALRCAPSPETGALLHYNLGVSLLAGSLAATDGGLVPLPGSVPAWEAAGRAFADVVDSVAAPPAVREVAGRLMGLSWCLSGVCGRDQRVRARLLALHNAQAALPEGDPVRAIAAAAAARLGELGTVARLVGRHDVPLPEEERLVPLRVVLALRLPEGLAAAPRVEALAAAG